MKLDRWLPSALVLLVSALVHQCEGRELSLYRVESSVQHDKAKQQTQHNTLLEKKHVFEESLSEIENEKVRSEEARLLQERREMFLRNLQMGGSSSLSMDDEAASEGTDEFTATGEMENEDAVDSFHSYIFAGTNEGMQNRPQTISIPVLQERARDYGWNKMALQAQFEDPNADANLRRRKA